MTCSTELFHVLVQMADSFHSVRSGRRWLTTAMRDFTQWLRSPVPPGAAPGSLSR